MNAQALLPVDTDTLLALLTYLRATGSELSLADAAAFALRTWLDGEGQVDRPGEATPSPAAVPASARGYQWKELFLPDGTEVRMRCDGDVHHARVTGDAIIYHGRRVSPRQLTLAAAGEGRNAWRDLLLRLPGEPGFQRASLLRHRVRASAKPAGQTAPRQSPADTIAAAAASMSEALRTALQLVEHSTAHALPNYERRLESHRRVADVMSGHVNFD